MSKKSIIYVDYAAATPVDPLVLQAMQPHFTDNFYNPSATYSTGLDARKALEAARGKVMRCLGARTSDIIFTAGGTEANNLAIHGVMRQFPGTNAVISSIEHESVLAPAKNYDYREAGVKPDGRIDLEALREAIDDQTILVSIMYANNEIGTIQPIREISQLLAKIREQRKSEKNDLPLYFHSDACQAGNYLDLHVSRLGVDLLSMNGGKIYGPKQSGALYIKAGTKLKPIIDGGGQERGLRSGTENVAGAVGFSAALELAQAMRHDETKRLQALQKQFIEELQKTISNVIINGSLKHRLPGNVHITIPGQDNERLLIQLDEAGIMAAAGSACSASNEEPSHVLRVIGLDDAEARASLRFTMGRKTALEDIKHTAQTLSLLVASA